MAGAALAWAEGVPSAVDPAWTTSVLVIFVAALLVWLDRVRSHETLLHANLGVGPSAFWGASLVTASVLEILAQVIVDSAGSA